MSWLSNPAYEPVRDELIRKMQRKLFLFENVSKFIFICGGKHSTRRDHLENLLKEHDVENFRVFRAEWIWEDLKKTSGSDLLSIEQHLARVSDLVLLILESPGTFTELGAFVVERKLAKKLLLVADQSFKDDFDSFINAGPIRYFDDNEMSDFGKTIHADFSMILSSSQEIKWRLDMLEPKKNRVTFRTLSEKPDRDKYILLLLCDIVAIVGPVPSSHVHYFAVRILANVLEEKLTERDVLTLLVLAKAMKFLGAIDLDERYYFRVRHGGASTLFGYKGLEFSSERLKVINILQKIPDARKVHEGLI